MVHNESTFILMSSTLHFDATNDAFDVVTLGGQIFCEAMECLEVCTACDLVPSGRPTASPPTPSGHPTAPPLATLYPTPQPKVPAHAASNSYTMPVLMAAAGVMAVMAGVVAIDRRRRHARRGSGRTASELRVEETPLGYQQPLLRGDEQVVPAPIVELVGCSIMNSYELSPAPIFVVGRNSMCVAKWSPGMEIAAPSLVDPVGLPVADLPFVNPSDGQRLDRNLRRIFEAPGGHDSTKTFVLHLRTRNGRVLLETRADHLVTESEAIVVFTGRQACMMAPSRRGDV